MTNLPEQAKRKTSFDELFERLKSELSRLENLNHKVANIRDTIEPSEPEPIKDKQDEDGSVYKGGIVAEFNTLLIKMSTYNDRLQNTIEKIQKHI